MSLPLLDGGDHPLVEMDEEATRLQVVELLRAWLSRHAISRPGRLGWVELAPCDTTGVAIARALVALGELVGRPAEKNLASPSGPAS